MPTRRRQDSKEPKQPRVVHAFGGLWTERKLAALEKYLEAYREIFEKGRWASKYETTYVDGFAGTGERARSDPDEEAGPTGYGPTDIFGQPFQRPKQESSKPKRGSARVALDLTSPFDHYLFIDKDDERANQLRELIARDYAALEQRTKVEAGDANTLISSWCKSTDWARHRAVVFLDPYGMSVDWTTIECIAATKAIDLWILFPLGIGLNRMLTRDKEPPAAWMAKIDRILGTKAWREIFYKELVQQGIFGDKVTRIVKTATFASMTKFFLERLGSVFEGVSPHAMALMNSRGNPLFMLCFAAGSKTGAPIAVRIANHLLKD